MKNFFTAIVLAIFALTFLASCGAQGLPKEQDKSPKNNPPPLTINKKEGNSMGTNTIYLAGGCFWGMEKLMSSLTGVQKVTSGYANSDKENPTYKEVCTGTTNARETVKVDYDPQKVSLETVLFAYFSVLDPTVANRQGNDRGSQYQTGIYYNDGDSEKIVKQVVDVERKRWKTFKVEVKPLSNFYPAEEYHQQYLEKNPGGYCHISPRAIEKVKNLKVDAHPYQLPDPKTLKSKLTPEQYAVTQERGTERPFTNKYDAHFAKGIYVDIVTGEPLFLSADKFDSGCGWPAFSKPIDPNVVVEQQDSSLGMQRTEVSSRTGSSHLGHVFFGEPNAPGGVRYCIDSAALRFIAEADMDKEGYGAYKKLLDKQ